MLDQRVAHRRSTMRLPSPRQTKAQHGVAITIIVAVLWRRGQALEKRARKPVRGILDYT
jgi:hypothetical protein